MRMGTVVLAIRVLLAAVFATAGVGKLLDRTGSRRALEDFGAGPRLAAVGAVALPIAELGTAVALLLPDSALWGAAAALVLLGIFIVGIARALARGQAPDCHCFGQIHSAPAGRGTLLRNVALALSALVVLLEGPGPSITAWIDARTAAELVAVALGLVALIATSAAVTLWFRHRKALEYLEKAEKELSAIPAGLLVGLPAPEFALPSLDGEMVSLEELCGRGRPVALMFATPDCGGCQQLLPDIGRWQSALRDRLTVAVVSAGEPERNREAFQKHGIRDVVLQQDGEVMGDYRVVATPSAVLIDPDGKIASAMAAGQVTIESLVRLALSRRRTSLALGSAALLGEQQVAESA
jgi:methylamine dehydrogenase accessory protein MauD